MQYAFEFGSRDRLNRAQVLQRFQNESAFRDIDGQPIPEGTWKKWLTRRRPRWVRFGQDIGRDIDRLRSPPEYRHRHVRDKLWWEISGVSKDPGKHAKREQLFRADIMGPHDEEVFKPSHAFPLYKRIGYPTLQDFLDGQRWSFKWSRKAQKMHCFASRHVYELRVPVVDPASGTLLFNLYPVAGMGITTIPPALLPTDDRLFLRV